MENCAARMSNIHIGAVQSLSYMNTSLRISLDLTAEQTLRLRGLHRVAPVGMTWRRWFSRRAGTA